MKKNVCRFLYAFKRITGMTPLEYRQYRKQIACFNMNHQERKLKIYENNRVRPDTFRYA